MRPLTLVALAALVVLPGAAEAAPLPEPPVWPAPFQMVTDLLTLWSDERPPELLTLLTSATGGKTVSDIEPEPEPEDEDDTPLKKRPWIFDF